MAKDQVLTENDIKKNTDLGGLEGHIKTIPQGRNS